MADQARITELFSRYLNGTATPEETTELMACVADPQNTDAIRGLIGDAYAAHREEVALEPESIEYIFSHIYQQGEGEIVPLVTRRLFSWSRIAAAASIILALSVSGYFILRPAKPTKQLAQVKNDIAPGRNQATLTLANGQKIILTKGLAGTLARQGGIAINVNAGNSITYSIPASQGNVNGPVQYNTLATARGEQSPYPLVLADGTKVWLNAASSITFPTAFTGKERIVKITGEAYFEVKHNANQPFKVQAPTQTIQDIGTSFDVNAYTDEPNTKTTLIEGSVKINNLVLKPNEQTDGSHIRTVNTDIYTAWKDGNFHFEGDNIQTIMRQLARWYNIDISYQGKITNEVFYADISRSRNISAVLNILQNSNGVNFKIEGRRVMVIE